jgi:hypothetical protein
MPAKVLVAKNGRCMWWCDDDGSHSPIYGTTPMSVVEKTNVRNHVTGRANKHNLKDHKKP